MAKIIVYSGSSCPYCDRAKLLLRKKGVSYDEIDVRKDETKLNEMLEKSKGKRTIPQIFINGQHIGGCEELYALDAAGKLDPLLAG